MSKLDLQKCNYDKVAFGVCCLFTAWFFYYAIPPLDFTLAAFIAVYIVLWSILGVVIGNIYLFFYFIFFPEKHHKDKVSKWSMSALGLIIGMAFWITIGVRAINEF